jgi:hypothetical protein
MGGDMAKWIWGDIHTADFPHPLLSDGTKSVFGIAPVRRGGDAYTVMAASSPTQQGAKQLLGASFKFVFDVQDWDRSTGLSTPGNSGQTGSPHYADLAPLWGEGKHFPLAFSRKKVEEVSKERLLLYPVADNTRPGPEEPFEPVQPELFSDPGAQVLAWGDYDNDGYLDLFVGFRGGLSRLYHNDRHGHFVDVSAQVGITDGNEVRAAAWGDFDGDGNLDLYVGYAQTSSVPNRLYHNDGHGHFTDVARSLGIEDHGETRQVSFVDYDNDGDVDLYVTFRNPPNKLYRNDGGKFVEIGKQAGVADPRKTVGAVWFDFDQDGDLDLFVANQDGDLNGFYRNDGGKFVDIAHELGIDGAGRPGVYGSVGVTVGDYNNDGRLDMYVANYGPSWLLRNDDGKFVNVAPQMGVSPDRHFTVPAFSDYDNDGRLDLYIASYLTRVANVRDYLFHNDGDRFSDVTPAYILKHDGTHGVVWADYDQDGALDLSIADNGPQGVHYIYRNRLPPEKARRSLQVLVVDAKGHYTRAGSEVRVYAAGTRTLLGTRLVDTGSGYCAQNAMPVHFGLPAPGRVDVEVTTLTQQGRKVLRVAGVDPQTLKGKPLTVKTGN